MQKIGNILDSHFVRISLQMSFISEDYEKAFVKFGKIKPFISLDSTKVSFLGIFLREKKCENGFS